MSGKRKTGGAGRPAPVKGLDPEGKRGRRFLFLWLPVILCVLFFFYALAFDPAKPLGPPVRGIMATYGQEKALESVRRYPVTLDDGRSIEIDAGQVGTYRRGKAVLVQENETAIFRRRTFSFLRYLDAD